MSALGSLVVKLALDHAEYTQGLDRTSQEALKFAKSAQQNFDQAANSTKEFLGNVAGNVAGAIAGVVGLNAAFSRVTESINILNSLDDAAQKTGSSIEDLSRIEQVARNFGDAFQPIEQGITRLAKGLSQIDDPSSDVIRALDAINVSARDSSGQLRTAGDVYIDVARKLQDYKDGAEKTAVVNALFGKSGAELLPMLNNLAQGIDHVSAVSARNTQQAAQFNDSLALTKANVNGLFMSMAVELLPTLNNIASAVNNSSGQFNTFSAVSSATNGVLKGLAIAAFTVVDTFRGMGREIGARAAQLSALVNLDFSGAKFIGQALAEDNIKSRAEYDKFVDTILNGERKIESAINSGGTKEIIKFQANLPQSVNAATKSIEKQSKAFDIEVYKLKQYEAEAKRARDITESVATKQERYNRQLEELESLKPGLSIETYNRKLQQLQEELQGTANVNRSVVSEMDQLWVQAGRNIQSTLSNSVFDFFSGGLDSMVSNVKTAVLRIVSEFAGLKIAQSVGLSAMFAIPGSAAAQTAAGGIGGTGALTAINATSLGATALNFAKGGFGFNSLAGGALSFIGGNSALGAFGSGMAGGAIPGISSQAALLGSSVAAVSGPLIAAFAATQVAKSLAGDKRIGGGFGSVLNAIGDTPIIGDLIPIIPILNGLFGRGPLKQRETTLSGTLGTQGFTSGALQTDFVAKGGLFRSDKNDFARIDAVTGEVSTDNRKLQDYADQLAKSSREIIGLINDTTINASRGLRQVAGDLNLSTSALDSFNHQINLVSEKGKGITQEQVSAEIEKISDSLARSLVPSIDSLAKSGESALQAVNRLGQEFNALVSAGTNIGASLASSREFILNASFDQRTTFVDAAGGVDALLQKTQFFADNFLTEAQRLGPVQDRLNEELVKLGLTTDLTKNQFAQLVQSFGSVNGISQEMMQSLLNLAPAFITVRNAAEAAAKASEDAAKAELERVRNGLLSSAGSAFAALQKSVERERAGITERYNQELGRLNNQIQAITGSINKLKSFSDSLKSTVNSLNPLSRDLAKAQINTAISTGRIDADKLKFAIDAVANQPSGGLTPFEAAREQAKSAILLDKLRVTADKQVDEQKSMLDSLERQKGVLTFGFEKEIGRLDAMLAQGQSQLDALNGINNSILSLSQSLARFNGAVLRLGGQAVSDVNGKRPVSGNPGITDQQIRDFVNAPGRTAMEIYNAARDNGVSFAQYARATGSNLKTLRNWAKANGLPVFADGGMHNGGLRIVGERGPELEYTGPSRIVSNNDIGKMLNNDDVIASIKSLSKELGEIRKSTGHTASRLDAVTMGGTKLRVAQLS